MKRFWAKVDKTGDCWIWTGYVDARGYARFQEGHRSKLAHRVAYEITKGHIPAGLTVDHICFNPICVRPDHLQLLTHSANVRRQRSAQKDTCKNGHPFTPENTYIKPASKRNGRRSCRQCAVAATQRYRARRALIAKEV